MMPSETALKYTTELVICRRGVLVLVAYLPGKGSTGKVSFTLSMHFRYLTASIPEVMPKIKFRHQTLSTEFRWEYTFSPIPCTEKSSGYS